jgi:hypothetical protein
MAKPKKVKRAKPKVSKDININIKNIMSQIQNQPKRDYIKPQKKIPLDSFNTGQMYRAFAPAITYASNPLQAFQGVAPIANPPATQQLTSMPAVYKSEPIKVEANPYDIEPVRQPAPFRAPEPVASPLQFRPGDYAAVGSASFRRDYAALAAATPASAFRDVSDMSPIKSGTYSQPVSPLTLPVSTPISQPNTRGLDIIGMLGGSRTPPYNPPTPPYNPPPMRPSGQTLRESLAAQAAPAEVLQKPTKRPSKYPNEFVAQGKVQISDSGRPMFPPKKMGQ